MQPDLTDPQMHAIMSCDPSLHTRQVLVMEQTSGVSLRAPTVAFSLPCTLTCRIREFIRPRVDPASF